MKSDVKWKSMSRQFGVSRPTALDQVLLGRGRTCRGITGSPWKGLDPGSRFVMIMMSVFALAMLAAVDGLLALLWLCAAGPLALGFALIIANAGGVVWCRLVTTGYAACILIGVGWAMAAAG